MFYVLGILSAIAFGSTWVLQQHEAAQAPEDLELHPVRLVRRMARRPLWLLGLVLLAVGSALQEATIALSSLSRAESLLILDLVWALVLSRRVSRVRVGRLQWGGAAAVCVGLTVLLLFGDPTTGRGAGPLPRWVAVLAVTAVASAVACVFAVRRRGTARAVALSVTAGLLFGVSDALSKAAFDSPSLLSALSAWQVYACLGTAVIAIGLSQIAYNAARLVVSLPGLAVAEPLAGVVVGVLVLHVHFQAGSWSLAAEAAAGAVLVAGSVLIARAQALDVAAWRSARLVRRRPAPPAARPAGGLLARAVHWFRWWRRLAAGSRQPSG